jgi:hypothetical protein
VAFPYIDIPSGLWETRDSRLVYFSSFAGRLIAPCRSGGIGRRAWFRSMYSQGCGGSSPPFGTKIFNPGRRTGTLEALGQIPKVEEHGHAARPNPRPHAD